MFGIYHQESARKKIKFILNLFRNKFFFSKSILDVGPGSGDMSGLLFQMGGAITAIDANIDILKNINKKHPQIRTIQKDLDKDPKIDQRYDIIFHIGTLNHLQNWKEHLSNVCGNTKEILFLETAVCDSNDPDLDVRIEENNIIGGSHNKIGSRTSAEAIEKILQENNLSYYRVDLADLNYQKNVYNWKNENNGKKDISLRRFWICSRRASITEQLKRKYSEPITNSNLQIITDDFNEEVKVLPDKEIKLLYEEKAPKKTIEKNNIINGSVNNLENIKQNTNVFKKNYNNVSSNNVSDVSDVSDVINNKFVIVIPSYKNEKWARKNILSCLNQNYSNFRIIFTDDYSPDNTFEEVNKEVNNHPNKNKCILIKNKYRKGALENLYDMIHSCEDDEIILTLDGDDWFANENVLNYLNQIYQNKDVWMTYGQYKCYPNGNGHCKEISKNTIKSNNFRQSEWLSSHLRTFYAWLFKKINKEDLMYENKFAPSAWDMYIMFPMLEMAGERSKFIGEILYIYNLDNPINDHKVDRSLQQRLDNICRKKNKYTKISEAPKMIFKNKKNIGLLIIATNKYDKFVQPLISSADKLFLNEEEFKVKYFIFTDSNIKPNTTRDYQIMPIQHKPFPHASMDRFKHFYNNKEYLSEVDYLYYVDVDCKFVDKISSEIIGNLVGVRHCGYFNGGGTFETNKKSIFYTDPSNYKYYFGGGFSGGKTEKYLELSKWCDEMIDKDLSNGIIPIYHDETAINKYFLDNQPDIILSPSYHYPESNLEYYFQKWKPYKFEPKILLLDKNHKEIRS